MHHGFVVGRVEETKFDYENSRANYQLFIYAPFDQLVFERTQFWLDSGLEVKFGANGLDVKLSSLETLITGGVSFDVAKNIQPGAQIIESMTDFKLYASQDKAIEAKYDDSLEYALLFEESVRGLSVGAPVEFRGIRIGRVKAVPLSIPVEESGKITNRIPVLIGIEIERVSEVFRKIGTDAFAESLEQQMKEGLRATLKTGNLLTGALFIDLNFYDDSQAYEPATFDKYHVFPTDSGGLTHLQNQVNVFLKKINDLPLDKTVSNLNKLLASLDKTTQDIDELLSSEGAKNLPQSVNDTMTQLESTLQGYDEESEVYQQLVDTAHELELLMKELKPLIETLNEKPNALVFGADEKEDPIPVKGVSE
ncbi:paraquat-inducible protein B [Vibrio astriarenae]|nr:paraquat-inducible protein B [Vibrio sp. C7]